jgi:hypothetical protein
VASSLAFRLTGLVVPLAAAAAASGLFVPGLYHRDPAAVVPALRGQDALTLLALPALSWAALAARRGSARATLVWLGGLGYVLYTSAGAAFAYHFNGLFLVYVALFSLSVAAVAAGFAGLDAGGVRRRFGAGAPAGPVAAFLALSAVILAGPELAQVAAFFATGLPPEIVARSGASTSFVHALDLGVVTPLLALAAAWLRRGSPWGFVLAGVMLIKCATMGLALLLMTGFSVASGLPLEAGLTAVYGFIAAGGLGFSAWFLRACRG